MHSYLERCWPPSASLHAESLAHRLLVLTLHSLLSSLSVSFSHPVFVRDFAPRLSPCLVLARTVFITFLLLIDRYIHWTRGASQVICRCCKVRQTSNFQTQHKVVSSSNGNLGVGFFVLPIGLCSVCTAAVHGGACKAVYLVCINSNSHLSLVG